eukprot:gene8572-8754_t
MKLEGKAQQELRAVQVPCSAAGVLLQQLPLKHLTCLRLHMYEYSDLDSLTNLRWLDISRTPSKTAAQFAACTILPALKGLGNLVRLDVSGVDKFQLSLLPTHLKQLSFTNMKALPSLRLQLSHLQALTTLTFKYGCNQDPNFDLPVALTHGDCLPQSIQRLKLARCESVQPLAPLQQLTALHLVAGAPCAVPPHQLLMGLAGLRHLQKLSVTFNVLAGEVPPEALPSINAQQPGWPLLRQMSLTQLPSSSIHLIAPLLQHMTALQQLALRSASSQPWQVVTLMKAVARLPLVRQLMLGPLSFTPDAAAVLAMTQSRGLEELQLFKTGLNDFKLSILISKLSSLKTLALICENVTDGPLPLLLQQLTQLTHIVLSTECPITLVGLDFLYAAMRVRKGCIKVQEDENLYQSTFQDSDDGDDQDSEQQLACDWVPLGCEVNHPELFGAYLTA